MLAISLMNNLYRVLNRNMLLNSLIPFLVIELVLLFLYFWMNSYTSTKNQQALMAQIFENINLVAENKLQKIRMSLSEVSHNAKIIQTMHQRFFEELDSCEKTSSELYGVHANGAFFKKVNDGGASLYYSSETPLTEQVLKKALCSEQMDTLLKSTVDGNPVISQAYINTWDDMNRIYPFIEDSPSQFGSAMDMESFNFYYLANSEHNPQQQPVWTSAYLDPAGQGWMVSNIVPIYHQGRLEGVSGLDVTLKSFIDSVLQIDLPNYASAVMVDADGVIIAMQDAAAELLNLPSLNEHYYDAVIEKTIEKPEQYNLFDSESNQLSYVFDTARKQPKQIIEATLNNKSVYINAIKEPQLGWNLFILFDKQQINTPVNEMQALSLRSGMLMILFVIAFYFIFFVYIKRRSNVLASTVADPLTQLSEQTSDIRHLFSAEPIKKTGITEIDQLVKNVDRMGKTLSTQTNDLISAAVKQQSLSSKAIAMEDLAGTDSMTNIANRRKLEQVLEQNRVLAEQSQQVFSIIYIDLDYFKSVNDNFGHDKGDEVLITLVEIVKGLLRSSDLLGRWGGEEFMVICSDCTLDNAVRIAEKLRQTIANSQYPIPMSLTASFGVASYQQGELISDLIIRADKYLYQAKRAGRNRVISG